MTIAVARHQGRRRIEDTTGAWTVTVDPLLPNSTSVSANGYLLICETDGVIEAEFSLQPILPNQPVWR